MPLQTAAPSYVGRDTPAPRAWAIPSLIAAVAVAGLSKNPSLSLLSVSVLYFIWLGALSNPIKTMFACYFSFQWAQASTTVWLANAYGVDLSAAQLVPLCSNCFLAVSSRSEEA